MRRVLIALFAVGLSMALLGASKQGSKPIEVTPTSFTLAVGATGSFTAHGELVMSVAGLARCNGVASVDATAKGYEAWGVVKGLNPGTCTFDVLSGNMQLTVTVTVTAATPPPRARAKPQPIKTP
jgi:hypothetical protein